MFTLQALYSDVPFSSLIVFRWAELIVDTKEDCELLPLIVQQFLILYLYKIPQIQVYQFTNLKNWVYQTKPNVIYNVALKLQTLKSNFVKSSKENEDALAYQMQTQLAE